MELAVLVVGLCVMTYKVPSSKVVLGQLIPSVTDGSLSFLPRKCWRGLRPLLDSSVFSGEPASS